VSVPVSFGVLIQISGHLVVTQGAITLKKIGMAGNPTNMLTKQVRVLKFKHCLDLIGVCSL
jgi:hypothetical protein